MACVGNWGPKASLYSYWCQALFFLFLKCWWFFWERCTRKSKFIMLLWGIGIYLFLCFISRFSLISVLISLFLFFFFSFTAVAPIGYCLFSIYLIFPQKHCFSEAVKSLPCSQGLEPSKLWPVFIVLAFSCTFFWGWFCLFHPSLLCPLVPCPSKSLAPLLPLYSQACNSVGWW